MTNKSVSIKELDKRSLTLIELIELQARGMRELKARLDFQEQKINLLTVAVQQLSGDSVEELAEARDFAAEHAETCQLEDLYGAGDDSGEAAV